MLYPNYLCSTHRLPLFRESYASLYKNKKVSFAVRDSIIYIENRSDLVGLDLHWNPRCYKMFGQDYKRDYKRFMIDFYKKEEIIANENTGWNSIYLLKRLSTDALVQLMYQDTTIYNNESI